MSLRSAVAEVARVVAEHYEKLITVSVQFTELRNTTTSELGEFKAALLRLERTVADLQVEQAKAIAELRAATQSVDARLSILSERALHIAVTDMARSVVERRLQVQAESETHAANSSEEGGT